MQIKQAATCALLIILHTDLICGTPKEPEGNFGISKSDSTCQVWTDNGHYVVTGDSCLEFPKNFTFNVTALSIVSSSIKTIKQDDFSELTYLKSLTIDRNAQLLDINVGAFSGMDNLENLTITNNAQLAYLNSETLTGLDNLQHLVLSKNSFSDFYCISQAVRPQILPSLISLDVSGNTFRQINHTDGYHMNSTTLQVLKLTACSISHIEGTAFNNLPHLTALHIENNNLQTNIIVDLICNISENSDRFIEIHIGANYISDPNVIFSLIGDTRISILDLSNSRFTPVIANMYCTLPAIIYLDLSATGSALADAYFTSDMFPNIEYLFLSMNRLLNRPFSMSLPTLRYLDLSSNVHSDAYYSIFSAGFVLENMTSLEVLKLDSNPITTLEHGSFQNLSKLKELYLVNTSLQSFGIAPFSGLGSLEILDLSSNNFITAHTINNTTLIGLSNLKTLILDQSMLTCLADDLTFTHTPQLEHLSLKFNSFLELHPHLLHPVPHLISLDLSRNTFQSWEQRLFEKNENLETLSLRYNQITTFTPAMLQDFSGLKKLDLTKNTLSCDCHDISAIFPYIDTGDNQQSALVNAVSRPKTFCTLPSDLRFSSYWETARKLRSDGGCKSNVEFIVKLVIICASSGIVVSIPIFYFLRWHIKYWIFLLRQAMSCYIFPKRKSPATPGKYMYDAFVSYSNEDRGFVVRLVSMLENRSPRFRLCVYERDFAVGGVITDNVVQSLAKSKRTILILSDAFARSTWCQWEMNLAQHKRLFFKDDQHGPLIIIKIGEIMDKHMTPTLRYLTKTRIYLQWNSDPIKQKVFWEKLRSALAAPLRDDDDDDDGPKLKHSVLNSGETVNNVVNISHNGASTEV